MLQNNTPTSLSQVNSSHRVVDGVRLRGTSVGTTITELLIDGTLGRLSFERGSFTSLRMTTVSSSFSATGAPTAAFSERIYGVACTNAGVLTFFDLDSTTAGTQDFVTTAYGVAALVTLNGHANAVSTLDNSIQLTPVNGTATVLPHLLVQVRGSGTTTVTRWEVSIEAMTVTAL